MGVCATGALGRQAERLALTYLVRQGLTPVARNFRCRGGEIDLIMLHDDCLTFIEVRYRASTRFSSPAPTVDSRKQRKIIATAAMFIAREKHFANHTMRFDVVAIAGDGDVSIDWIQDAFRPQDSRL